MSDYTIKNLRDVNDAAVDGGFSKVQEARFARKDLDAQATGIAFHLVRAGKRQAFAHHHHDAEEVYVVLSGTGRAKLGDDIIDLSPLDALRVAPDVTRAFEAGADDMEFLAFGPHHDSDGEIVKDFWPQSQAT